MQGKKCLGADWLHAHEPGKLGVPGLLEFRDGGLLLQSKTDVVEAFDQALLAELVNL
jgi:hypothetical protein